MKKKILLLFSFLCAITNLFALSVDGVDYRVNADGKTVTVVSYSGTAEDLVIPATIDSDGVTCQVTAIASNAFSNGTIKQVSLPEGLLSIGAQAFFSCKSLESINIPTTVTTIGDHCFQYCSNLSSEITLKSVTRLEDGVFEECSSLQKVNLECPLTRIGYSVFLGTAIKSIDIPEGVVTIDSWAFQQSSITRLDLPSTIDTIGRQTFEADSIVVFWAKPSATAYIEEQQYKALLILPDSATYNGINASVKKGFKGFIVTDSIRYAYVTGDLLIDGESNTTVGSFSGVGKYVVGQTANISYSIRYPYYVVGIEGVDSTEMAANASGIPTNISFMVQEDRHIVVNVKEGYSVYVETTLDPQTHQIYLSETKWGVSVREIDNPEIGYTILTKPLGDSVKIVCTTGLGYILLAWSDSVPATKERYFCGTGENLVRAIIAEDTVRDSDTLFTIGKVTYVVNADGSSVSARMVNPYYTSGDISIPASVEHNGVTYKVNAIVEGGFEDCGITSLVLPSTIAEIPNKAFKNCKLDIVSLPEGLTSIGESAFYGNSTQYVYLPSTLKEISSTAFSAKPTEGFVVLSEKPYIIEGMQVYASNVIVPDSVAYWNYVGSADWGIFNVIVDGNIEKLTVAAEIGEGKGYVSGGGQFFKNESVSLKAQASDGYSFAYWETEDGEKVYSNPYAFSLTDKDVNLKVYFLQGGCYIVADVNDTTGGRAYVEGGSNTVALMYGDTTKIYAEPKDGYVFIKWNDNFEGNTENPRYVTSKANTEYFTYPNHYTAIFYKAEDLVMGTITDSVNGLVYEVFGNGTARVMKCNGTTASVQIPDTVSTTEEWGNGRQFVVTSIRDSAFMGTSIRQVELPTTLSKIGTMAFYHCDSLETINLHAGITSIGDHCFQYCGSLSCPVVLYSLSTLEDGLFEECASLTDVTIACQPERIGYSVFLGTAIDSITIPKGVKQIDQWAFKYSSLKKMVVESENLTIEEYALQMKDNNSEVTIYALGDSAYISAIKSNSNYIDTIYVKDLKVMKKYQTSGLASRYTIIPLDETAVYYMAVSAQDYLGYVRGGGWYFDGEKATIAAVANNGYAFDSWIAKAGGAQIEDNNRDSKRQIVMKSEMEMIAIFKPTLVVQEINTEDSTLWKTTDSTMVMEYNLDHIDLAEIKYQYLALNAKVDMTDSLTTAKVNCYADSTCTELLGTIDLVSEVKEGEHVAAGAPPVKRAPAAGSEQLKNNICLPEGTHYLQLVISNASMETAEALGETFSNLFMEVDIESFKLVTESEDSLAGKVIGTGTYEAGDSISIEAIAEPGYQFAHWSDGSTIASRSVLLTSDTLLTAYFTEVSGIEKVESENNGKVDVYTVSGVKMKSQTEADDALNGLRRGIYIVGGKKVYVNK